MKLLPLVAVCLLLGACPAPQPVPPSAPDASDASRPVADSVAPATPCQAACAALVAVGCQVGAAPDCVTTLAAIDGRRLIRTPCGRGVCPPLTCAALATVQTALDAVALGVSCVGP